MEHDPKNWKNFSLFCSDSGRGLKFPTVVFEEVAIGQKVDVFDFLSKSFKASD
jgi:hypothetical protein